MTLSPIEITPLCCYIPLRRMLKITQLRVIMSDVPAGVIAAWL